MKHEVVVLVLWLIAIVATMLLVDDPTTFTRLAPIHAICMIGSVVNVRWARGARGGPTDTRSGAACPPSRHGVARRPRTGGSRGREVRDEVSAAPRS